ncbi:disintegrin and metalloproteinase domain-containing protein 9-like isoform X2 [Physella acuta]|uniref:disintegrin and metalloproteinase domain-containing protein 9-like isoform X2 n=1 Tax=Physella acuta TaxID=109671 RepID=UPI0027DBB8D7|nr:disintegrin and metalloproteinase domain-containing protein 9-like isoform X2 [Physella acuta]
MELWLSRIFRKQILFFFICISCIGLYKGDAKDAQKLKRLSFFNRYHDSIPSILHQGRPVEAEAPHLDNITVEFRAFGRLFVVDLHRNKQLFSSSYVEKIYHPHGPETRKTFSQNQDNCFYHGSLRFQPKSEAALSTCQGLSGYVTDHHDTYHIEPLQGKVHRIYRNKDQKKLPFRCGTEGHDGRLHEHRKVISRHKRSVLAPYDSNSNTRYVELYLVNDYRAYERFGKNTELIIKRSKDIANIVSSLYRQLNIYVALVGVEVWSGGDQVSVTPSADNTMENFLRYRKERINPYHHNDNAQLITGVFFEHGVVGKAIKGPICTHQFSGGVNMDYGGVVTLVATTVAHEIGHNFGMEHDNDTMCECRDDKCIMAATSGQISPKKWSSCSQNALAEAFDLGMDYCLQNIPETIYRGPICGNGLTEEGEECDCGLPQDCTNRCCNATVCKLHPLARCGTGKCCDLSICKPKESSTLCRAPGGECDLAEFCDGQSEHCPTDVFLQNGLQCKGGQSYCYNGQCKTHSDQCKLLWGETGRVSDPFCFQQLNIKGDNDGHCGYNWTTDRYKRCDKENVMCGLLHCVHLNEKLMFWKDSLTINTRATFLSQGNKQYVCRSAMLDVGLDMPDPGFVPDGAKCEHDKICINQQCLPVAKLKVRQCPDNCHGHGRCNSNGNCHCNAGYAPPLCDRPGYGGSIDSGPASDEYAKKDILIALLVVFLLVIPILIILIIGFIKRKRLIKWWNAMPSLKDRFEGKPGKLKARDYPAKKELKPRCNDRENLIFNPPPTHAADPHPKPKVWNTPETPAPPPERPKRPPSLVKNKSAAESKNLLKKVKLSVPIQETCGPPSPPAKQKKVSQRAPSGSKKTDLRSIPEPQNPIVKRESFRGSQISEPVLVCTTNRNSLVLADGNVDIIGPEARLVTRSPTFNKPAAIKRTQSDRPLSRPDPHHPAPPAPGTSTLKKSASARSPTNPNPPVASSAPTTNHNKTNPSGFRPRPIPPIPTEEEDDTQPIYTNETSDMSDLLSAIEGALKASSNIYTNLSPAPPTEELPPPTPPRSTSAAQPLPSQLKTKANLATSTQKPANLATSIQKPANLATSTQKPANLATSTQKPANLATSTQKPANLATSTQKPVNLATSSQKPANLATSTQKPASSALDVQTNKAPAVNKSTTNKAATSNIDNPAGKTAPAQRPASVADSKEKLKGAISDELRSRVLSQSVAGQGDIHKAAPKSVKRDQASSATPPKPLPPSTQGSSAVKVIDKSNKVIDKSNKVIDKGSSKKAASTKSIPSNKPEVSSSKTNVSSNKPEVSSSKPEVSSNKTNVSSIAARFGSAGQDTPTTQETHGKKVPARKVAVPDTAAAPDTAPATRPADRPVTRAQSMSSARPSLPPKPDQATTVPAPSNAQPKRVQSYRI